eukprot:g1650.t1
MPGGESSSEEFVEDDSGGEGEEEEEGDSSAYESEEESEDDDDDDDDDGATGDDSDVFETPIKARKRSRTPSQPAAASSGKSKRKTPPSDGAPASATAAANGSKKKKGPAATGPAAPPSSTKNATARAGAATATAASSATKGKGKGKGKGAASTAAGDDGLPSSQEGVPATEASSSPGAGSQAAPGGGQRGGSGGKGSPATSAPHTTKAVSGGAGRAGGGGGGGVARPPPAKTPKAAVSDYMQQSNRPYSYINVFDNLRKKIPKAMVQKLLDELVRDGTLNVQEYGKAKIYYANQDALPNGAGDTSAEKLRRLDQEAQSLTSQLEIASKQEQQSRSRVSLLSSQPTDAALAEKLDQSVRDLEQAEARNAAAKGEGRSVVAGSMKAAKSDFNKFRALWVDRKRNAMDVVDMIADGMEKKPKVVMGELGVELDEEAIPAKM